MNSLELAKKIVGKNFATGFALVIYIIAVSSMWIYCTVQVKVMVEIPPNVLKIGLFLLAAHGGVNVGDKIVETREKNGKS